MSTSTSTTSSDQKFDYLAKKVLESSGVLSSLPERFTRRKEACGALKDQLFHVKILERALDIKDDGGGGIEKSFDDGVIGSDNGNDNRNRNNSNASTKNSGNCNGTLFTCTDFSSSSFAATTNSNNDSDPPQYWSPPLPETNFSVDSNENSEYIKAEDKNNSDVDNEKSAGIDNDHNNIPLLEDFAPFSRQFYLAVGQLLAFIYSQPIVQNNHISTNNTSTDQNQNKQDEQNKEDDLMNSIENYSLVHNVHTVRITRILSTLMEVNIFGDGGSKMVIHLTQRKRKLLENNNNHGEQENANDKYHIDDGTTSFLDLLLHHTEQNSLPVRYQDEEQTPPSKIPLIQSLFKYFSSLSQLESHLYSIVRIHRSKATSINLTSMDVRVRHMKLTQELQENLEKEFESHISSLEQIMGSVYSTSDVTLRKKIRLRIGNLLHSFALTSSSSSPSFGRQGGNLMMSGGGGIGVENTNAAGIDSMLKILLRLLKGITVDKDSSDGNTLVDTKKGDGENSIIEKDSKLKDSHRHLLLNVLLPLHRPSGMVLWRDQKPILGLYHQSLVQCIGSIVKFDSSLIENVIQYILHPDVWPLEGSSNGAKKGSSSSKMANTPKVILLLHEIDTLIGLLDVKTSSMHNDDFGDNLTTSDCLPAIFVPLVLRLASCISSDNSRTSERALEFFKNDKFKLLVKLHLSQVMSPLLRALCRVDSGMEVPWNPTVQKMTSLVLRQLQDFDEGQFKKSCGETLSGQNSRNEVQKEPLKVKKAGSAIMKSHDESPTADMMSLRKSMGSWKPPTKNSAAPSTSMPPPKAKQPFTVEQSRTPPPLTITGVAPWKVKAQTQKPSLNSQPPSTITGVAPWSVRSSLPKVKKSSSPSGSSQNATLRRKKVIGENRNNAPFNLQENHTEMDPPTTNTTVDDKAFAWVQSYIEKLKVSQSDNDSNADGISNWAKSQMSESPLLLPSLKFHDLVFGQVLGTGSFSTVKYARQIIKGKTRSYWPEFAIKIVSTQKIEEIGYENSINREIAILRMLSHPGIARLVSSFRFRDGAYLVLEYASAGDLHTLLKENGSLNQESTKFVIGELVAALHSIHELDLVYVDLKPENILITESGHCKLTDFGGCRPLTEKSKEIVMEAGQNLVKNLRDGDWRVLNEKRKEIDGICDGNQHAESNEGNFDDDLRIEGTTAYLPPEIILGGYPSFGTDAWALGCVFYQCLAGRPPLLEDSESSTRQRIVSFEIGGDSLSMSSREDNFFSLHGDCDDGTTFSNEAKDLIKRLLSRNPTDRPNMVATSEHSFFIGTDVFNLYKDTSRRLDAGRIAPRPDAQWTRRQFSSIWAPQPQAYKMTTEHDHFSNKDVDGPIPEGDESEGFFLTNTSSKKRPMLLGIKENK